VASCNLNEIGHLKGCPSLTELDVSFNHLPSLKALVDCLPHRNLTSLKFNDNLFSVIADQTATYNQNALSNLQLHPQLYQSLIMKSFPYLRQYNQEDVQPLTNKLAPCFSNKVCYRHFITKLLSQRLRVTYLNSAPLMLLLGVKLSSQLLSFQSTETLIYQCHREIHKRTRAALVIQSYLFRRRVKRSVLLKKFANC
jgi:Leucine-rich repeat (LRR) protein